MWKLLLDLCIFNMLWKIKLDKSIILTDFLKWVKFKTKYIGYFLLT